MVLIPFALDYAGVKGGANVDSLAEYFEKRESYMKGDSGLDLASMSLPEKLVTYAFRPFIFEARSIFGFAASIDNIIIVFLFGCGVFCAFRYTLDKGYGNKVFMTSYFFMAWFVLAMSTPNLGIALRQKWMFVPFFMYVAFSYINKRQVTVR